MKADEVKSTTQFNNSASIYGLQYQAHNPTGHSLRVRRSNAHALLGNEPLGRFLDIGGASGVYFNEFHSQVVEYHIVDISPKMIGLANKINNGQTPLFCQVASVYSLPYPDASFDTTLGMGLLEYPDEPWSALAEMVRITKPGGIVLASFPNAQSPMRRLSMFIYQQFQRPAPFGRLFSIEEVTKEAAKLGLRKISIRGYNAQLIPFPLTWHLGWLAYMQAVLTEPFLNLYRYDWGTAFMMAFQKQG